MNASQYLDKGERLLWAGNPDPLRYAVNKGATALFGILFLGFAIFWTVMASKSGGYFFLWGVPFMLVGAAVVLSPAFYYWRAPMVAYVLTDRRAVIDTQGPFGSRVSVPLDQVPFVTLKHATGGIGSVMFIENTRQGRRGRSYTTQDGFVAISDAEKVERQMRDAITALREDAA